MLINSNSTYIILVIIFLQCIISQWAYGQTFSRFYDTGVGFEDRARGSLLLEEDQFILTSAHSGDDFIITSFSRFDYEGNLIALDTINDFVIGRENSLIKTAFGYEALGHRWSKDATGARDIRLIKLDTQLQNVGIKEIYYSEGISVNAIGLLETEFENVIYGNKISNNSTFGTRGYIGFVNKEQDSIVQEITIVNEPGKSFESYWISSLQTTSDGNFAYIASPRSNEITNRFNLIKINQAGEEVASIEGFTTDLIQAGLVQDSEGGFYFYSRNTPYFIDPSQGPSLPDGGGGIVKVNAALDSVLWTIQLNSTLPNAVYRIYDTPKGMMELADGNFLIYGIAFGGLQEIQEWGAFLTKFTPEGEIIWKRFYQVELEESLQAINQNDTHIPTFLENCKELPDGRILCFSTLRFDLPDNPTHSEIWLTMLDDAGCLIPGCEEVTFITSTSSTLPTQVGHIFPNPVSDILQISDVSFDSYEIVDIVGRQVQVGGFSTEVALSSQLSKGMYILQLIEDGQLKSVFKFLKD